MANKAADSVIAALERGGLHATCPHCDEEFLLKRAKLFHGKDFSDAALALYRKKLADLAERRKELRQLPGRITEESTRGAGAVNLGKILERLAPSLPDFPYPSGDCRSVFDPLDYMVFVGAASKGVVDRIAFVELKSGGARLSNRQSTIRDAVERGKVEFQTYDPKERQ